MNKMDGKRSAPKGGEWNRLARGNRALFDACVRHAQTYGDAGRFGEAIRWCAVAAWSAAGRGWFGDLSSRALETELLRAAQQLPKPQKVHTVGSRPRWLHVLSIAYETFGHSNLCRRWIQNDTEVDHDLILVNQKYDVPKNLAQAVTSANGQCVVLDPAIPLEQRANDLRAFAWENADVVVLHTHPDDILGGVAFGVEGGPPVLLLNHADHLFWTGCTVADLVLDIRASGHLWTERNRGVDRTAILPVPLPGIESEQERDAADGPQRRRALRASLGIPPDATMLLTVGSAHKFQAMPGLDFIAAAREVIRKCDNTYLVAIGPDDKGVWRAAKRATGGRIMAIGYQRDSAPFCTAADVYLEGFPLGSLTALLEAGLAGLPCVRAPRDCVPPFASDDPSFEGLGQPENVNDYVGTVVSLVKDTGARAGRGLKLREAVQSQHDPASWLMRLRKIKEQIPKRHLVYPRFSPACVEENLRDWFLRFLYLNEPSQTVDTLTARVFTRAWEQTHTRPRLNLPLWRELGANASITASKRRSPTVLGEVWDRVLLWHLNKRIQRQGTSKQLMTGAKESFRRGQLGLARKMTYHCVIANPACLCDVAWLKFLVKVNIGQRLTLRTREFRARHALHFGDR